ncbi:MAG: hypothetical protein JSS58_07395, partial [Proteobacteria bacterium]|nr:hypothetical protein [Pseudomonadota bacterium]
TQPPAQEEQRLTVSLAPAPTQPLSQPMQPAPPNKPTTATPSQKKAVPPAKRKQSAPKQHRTPIAVARKETLPPPQKINPPQAAASDDFSARIEAARKRRAEAQMQAGSPPATPAAQADNSIALANIASAVREGRRDRQSDDGGVFQIRYLGYHDASFLFRGWSTAANRDRTRLIEVQQGANVDIQTAVVKKMIDIIREERSGDILWESHRLGRQLTLSARPRDEARLQQFLLQEFFPGYVPRNAAG